LTSHTFLVRAPEPTKAGRSFYSFLTTSIILNWTIVLPKTGSCHSERSEESLITPAKKVGCIGKKEILALFPANLNLIVTL
jgi:hypothetical protein